MTWAGRIGLLIVPPIAYWVTYRLCLGLQQSDRAVLEHGIETGIVRRLPHGEFIEIHQPLGPVDDHGHPIPLDYQGAPVPKRMNQLGSAGAPVAGSLLKPDPAPRRPRWSGPAARSPRPSRGQNGEFPAGEHRPSESAALAGRPSDLEEWTAPSRRGPRRIPAGPSSFPGAPACPAERMRPRRAMRPDSHGRTSRA